MFTLKIENGKLIARLQTTVSHSYAIERIDEQAEIPLRDLLEAIVDIPIPVKRKK